MCHFGKIQCDPSDNVKRNREFSSITSRKMNSAATRKDLKVEIFFPECPNKK
jgi:hypothetical protein